MRAAELLDADPLDLAVMRGYPRIPWLRPLHVRSSAGPSGWACRVCIARYGLDARHVAALPQDPFAVVEHLRAFHHLEP